MRSDSNDTLALEGADLEACRRVALWGVLDSLDELLEADGREVLAEILPVLIKRTDLMLGLGEPGEPRPPYQSPDLPERSLDGPGRHLLAQAAEEMATSYRYFLEDDGLKVEEDDLMRFRKGRLARAERVLRLLSEEDS